MVLVAHFKEMPVRLIRSVLLLLLMLVPVTACQSEVIERPSTILPSQSLTPMPITPPTTSPTMPDHTAATIATSGSQQDRAMYQMVINTFFRDSQVQRLFQPDLLQHTSVYIQPTFANTDTPIPDTIIQMITTHTTAQGLVPVQSEQSGGAVVTLGLVGNDPAAATVYQQRGPTIQISAYVSGTDCGASIGIGYLLTATDAGWQAQQYLLAVC